MSQRNPLEFQTRDDVTAFLYRSFHITHRPGATENTETSRNPMRMSPGELINKIGLLRREVDILKTENENLRNSLKRRDKVHMSHQLRTEIAEAELVEERLLKESALEDLAALNKKLEARKDQPEDVHDDMDIDGESGDSLLPPRLKRPRTV